MFDSRCFAHRFKSELTGNVFEVPGDDPELKTIIETGHQYWLLSEEIGESDAMLLSEWRNAEQNIAQFNSEIQLLKSIQKICITETKINEQVKLSTIIQKVATTSLTKLQPSTVGVLSKLCMELGSGTYVDQITRWHAVSVNPQNLACSIQFFDDLITTIPKQYVLCRVATIITQYNKHHVQEKRRPIPDSCKFISSSELSSVAKADKVLGLTEEFMRDTRNLCFDAIQKCTNEVTAYNHTHDFDTEVIRFILGKGSSEKFAGVYGKFEVDKLKQLRINWLTYLESTSDPLQGIAAKVATPSSRRRCRCRSSSNSSSSNGSSSNSSSSSSSESDSSSSNIGVGEGRGR